MTARVIRQCSRLPSQEASHRPAQRRSFAGLGGDGMAAENTSFVMVAPIFTCKKLFELVKMVPWPSLKYP